MAIRPILLSFALSLFAVACGSIEETPTNDPSSPGAQAAGGDRASTPGSTTPTGGTDPSASAPPVGSVKVVVHNTSASDVWLLRDIQAPLWLEIDGGLQLNGYGQSWCGTDPPMHNDPAWRLEKVAPGAPYAYTWDGHRVTFQGCWKKVPVAAGAHTARACLYDADVDLERADEPIPAGSTPPSPPSKWFSPAPARCVDFTFELPATGSITVDVDL